MKHSENSTPRMSECIFLDHGKSVNTPSSVCRLLQEGRDSLILIFLIKKKPQNPWLFEKSKNHPTLVKAHGWWGTFPKCAAPARFLQVGRDESAFTFWECPSPPIMGFYPTHKTPSKMGKSKLSKIIWVVLKARLLGGKKKNPLNILAFISSRWLTYAPGLLGSYK